MAEKPLLHPADERLIELIAERVTAALRRELETIVSTVNDTTPNRPLTVEQVAERFGIARSTVYAHWREWGGYKLGDGEKAAIRFDPAELRTRSAPKQQRVEDPANRSPIPCRRRQTLPGAPRLPTELDGGS